MTDPAQPDSEQTEPVRLSARCLRFPSLYDEESGVRFDLGPATVTVEQATKLAERPFMDRILIGEFDEDGRIVNEQPAKDWAKARRVAAGEVDSDANEDTGSGTGEQNTSDDATTVASKKTPRSK